MAKPSQKKPVTSKTIPATTSATTSAPVITTTAPAAKAPVTKEAVTKSAPAPKVATQSSKPAKPASTTIAKTATPKVLTKNATEKSATKISNTKAEKAQKLKMERDSFTMPRAEYAQLAVLKERLAALAQPAKKSELLRAGIMQLTALSDTALKAALNKVPTIKTGRPNKK